MGTHDAAFAALSPLPVEPDPYQPKIDEFKDALREKETHTPVSLAQTYAALRAEEDTLEAQRYALQIKLTALEQMIQESWDHDETGWGEYGAGPNTVRLQSGQAVDVVPGLRGKVEDPAAFRAWAMEHMPTKFSLPWQTMNAIAKDYATQAVEAAHGGEAAPQMPPGLIVGTILTVKLRKAKV